MCLILKRDTWQQMKRRVWFPITCYKVMKVRAVDPANVVISPIRNTPYILGENYETILTKKEYMYRDSEVHNGCHSFVNASDAMKYRNEMRLNESTGISYKIFKCKIPRFARYYKGVWDDTSIMSYASNRLIVEGEYKIQ